MRIGVVTSLYPSPPRPYEGVFAERRWLAMKARGHTVSVWHPQPFTGGSLGRLLRPARRHIAAMPSRENRSGIEVERPRYLHLPGFPRANARRFARSALAALDRCAGPPNAAPFEVVVCDYAWPAAALAPQLARRRLPCVISGRGSDVLEVSGEAGLGRELARYLATARNWCGVSSALVERMDALAAEAGFSGAGMLVPNGVDTELFRPRDRATARAQLGLPGSICLILVAGHLIPRKDPLLALEAFRVASASGALGEARLAFVGRGPLRERLAAAAAPFGDRVSLVDEQTPAQLASWYAAANLLLLTSWREGRPNVVLEALASGLPVVACDAGGTREVLPDAGMLVRERTPEAIAERVVSVLGASPPPAELAAAVVGYSWPASAATLERCLQRAIAANAC